MNMQYHFYGITTDLYTKVPERTTVHEKSVQAFHGGYGRCYISLVPPTPRSTEITQQSQQYLVTELGSIYSRLTLIPFHPRTQLVLILFKVGSILRVTSAWAEAAMRTNRIEASRKKKMIVP
jgi:hypothetical protein